MDLRRAAGLLALGLLSAAIAATPAIAAEFPPELDPRLSLTGDCSETPLDPEPDPSCPYVPPDAPIAAFDEPRAIAVDAYGNEYVSSYSEGSEAGRIDVFDDEGKFVAEFLAKGVSHMGVDSKGNVYVYREGNAVVRYSPSLYEPESGNIEYANSPLTVATESSAGPLAIDPSNDHLFVVRSGAIMEYSSAEEGNAFLGSFEPEKLGVWSQGIAVDGLRRRIYVAYCKNETTECGVLAVDADAPHGTLMEIDGSNTPSGKFATGLGRLSIAVDEETGNFFVYDIVFGTKKIYEFDENYNFVSELGSSAFAGNSSLQIAVSNGENASGDASNRHYLFVPTLQGGRALAFAPAAVGPPTVEEASAGDISETEAELRATIDPGGAPTQYVFEYTTQEAFDKEGYVGATVAGEGTIPKGSSGVSVKAGVTGLSPGTDYRFRVLAENEAGEGEPVTEVSFTTYADAPTSSPSLCPNEELRIGPSAALPDCRGYELVTPPDTNGRPPKGVGFSGDRFATIHVSPLGTAVSFNIEGGSLPGTNGSGSFRGDPYLATRNGSGWKTALAGPSGSVSTVTTPGSTSIDQGFSFWLARGEGPAVINGEDTRYVRYPDGHSELVGLGSLGIDPKAVGKLITEGGTHIVFETDPAGSGEPQQLEPDAPPSGTETVYDRTPDGVTHVVSLLPGDVTPAAGENASYLGASADGNGIAFEIKDTLYLRKDNAATYVIGENVEFAGVSDGGERIFYVEGGDLLAFDVSSKEVLAFSTTGNVTPVNVAPDGSRAYFVSPSVLGGENPNGALAQAGKQNLYLSEEGAISFVGTVTDLDVEGEEIPSEGRINGLGLWSKGLTLGQPGLDPSRLTPDGTVLLFESRASLDGQPTGGDPQVHRYESTTDRLHCISCIPTRLPAGDGASLETFTLAQGTPPPFGPNGFVPNMSPDGKRSFFESTEALVSTDSDGVQDVYEWEEEGVGSCQRPGGCIYLISSGRSDRDNYLFGHSATGDDVFFTTGDVLTGFDGGGTTSIYDARVGGGFPEEPDPICLAEGCRPPLTAFPALTTPAKPAMGANDNVKPRNPPRRCPKGKRKVKRHGKVRCVKKKTARSRRSKPSSRNRGAR